jgi:hypothetical protein
MYKTELQNRLLAFIGGASDSFDALALEVFAFQRDHNPPYRAYCDRLNQPVTRWQDIPAVPTSAFKHLPIACFPVAEAVAEFHTSGTTADQAGKHYFPTLELYDAASVPNFRAHLFSDGATMPLLSLVPDDPHSSLAHMIRVVGGQFVERLEPTTEPVCVLGTAFHFLNLFDAGFRLRLPAGSRVMETGGFKGRSREVSKRDLYRLFAERLGVTMVVNEYGMTELSTQFYDNRPGSDCKDVPPWARMMIIDPETGREATAGQTGLIRVFDLANLWSALAVQTEDLGVAVGDGFEIIGRNAGAEVRGCSLTVEEFRRV